MRVIFPIFTVFVLIGFCVTDVFACLCVNEDLSKRFKRANAVFVGGLYDFDQDEIPEIQNYKEGLPVLLVKRQWKGIKKELVAVDFDFPNTGGWCPSLDRFEETTDYLVFAYGKELKVNVECSDTQKLTPKYDQTTKEISKLDSFWFRSWSKLKFF